MSDPTTEHRRTAAGQTVRFAVLTISDTRTIETDRGGAMIEDLLREAGHKPAGRDLVSDAPARIAGRLRDLLDEPAIDMVVTTGGTGIGPRDSTIEVVERLLSRKLDGFGELFRMLSFEKIGPAAMLSRATGGLAGSKLVFALPGSPDAVELALQRLILPELAHLISECRGRPNP